MNRSLLLLSVALSVLPAFAAGSASSATAASHWRPPAAAGANAHDREHTPRDGKVAFDREDKAVMDSVLRWLLDNPKRWWRRWDRAGANQLLLGDILPSWEAPRIRVEGDLLGPGQLDFPPIPKALLDDQLARNSGRYSERYAKTGPEAAPGYWRAYRPADRRVTVIQTDMPGVRRATVDPDAPEWARYPRALGIVLAWLPGYSGDKKTALAQITVSHGSESVGAFLLEKRGGKWRVTKCSVEPPPL